MENNNGFLPEGTENNDKTGALNDTPEGYASEPAQSSGFDPYRSVNYASNQGIQNFGINNDAGYQNAGSPGFIGYQGPAQQYPDPAANQGQFNPYPAAGLYQPKQEKRLSKGWIWAICIVIAAMLTAIFVLAYAVIQGSPSQGSGAVMEAVSPEERVVINLPTYDKPSVEDGRYADKATGLLTTEGVAEVMMPSQVQIMLYGDSPFYSISNGSGLILTEDGYILTNAHVIDNGNMMKAVLYDGTEHEAKVCGLDRKSDIAVIKIDASGLIPATIGNSDTIALGEAIAVAGSASDLANTITFGHITALDRTVDTAYLDGSAVKCFQTDAALNPGNSGGPIVNMYGQVIGVAVAVLDHSRYDSVGFAININDAIPIAEQLIAKGYIEERAKIGILFYPITNELAEQYDLRPGLCISTLDPESDIFSSGVEINDIITEINGEKVFSSKSAQQALDGLLPGDTIRLNVFRKSITNEITEFEVDVKLGIDISVVNGWDSSVEPAPNDQFIFVP